MTEKEFLAKFIDFIYYAENKSNWYLAIDNFLERHHKIYLPVEFELDPKLMELQSGLTELPEWKFK